MSSTIELISLSELIAKVKSDLMAQVESDSGAPMLFVEGIELVAHVVAKREKAEGGKAGLSLSVLGFGANAGVDTKTTIGGELTQTVSVKLSPLLDKADYLAKISPAQKDQLHKTMVQSLVRGSNIDGPGPIS